MQQKWYNIAAVCLVATTAANGAQQRKATVHPKAAVKASKVTGHKGAVHQEILAFFEHNAAAFNRKDVDAVVRRATPDCTLTPFKGKTMTIGQWKTSEKRALPQMKTLQVKNAVKQMQVKGNSAVVTFTQTSDIRMHDYKQRLHRYYNIADWRVTLIKSSEGWLCKQLVGLSRQATLDGKPYMTYQTAKK